MRKTILLTLSVICCTILATGCSKFNKLLKSNDYETIYASAFKYYDEGKLKRALTCFEQVEEPFRGTRTAPLSNCGHHPVRYQPFAILHSS